MEEKVKILFLHMENPVIFDFTTPLGYNMNIERSEDAYENIFNER